jgi:hypothetical protein
LSRTKFIIGNWGRRGTDQTPCSIEHNTTKTPLLLNNSFRIRNNQFFEFHFGTSIEEESLREYRMNPTISAIIKNPELNIRMIVDDDSSSLT